MRKIAFSDIHGCNSSFGSLLDKVKPQKGDELFFLGDYIDRGPDSKGVIDRIWKLQDEGLQVKCLMGNHEQMLLESYYSHENEQFWLVNGGQAVLTCFAVSNVREIPTHYITWIMELAPYAEVDEYILVHAGLNFDTPQPFSNTFSMLWSRDWYEEINYQWLENRKIIHGHTPLPKEVIKKQLQELDNHQYLDIDAGCAHKGKRPGLGDLCAFDMTNKLLYFQENIDF